MFVISSKPKTRKNVQTTNATYQQFLLLLLLFCCDDKFISELALCEFEFSSVGTFTNKWMNRWMAMAWGFEIHAFKQQINRYFVFKSKSNLKALSKNVQWVENRLIRDSIIMCVCIVLYCIVHIAKYLSQIQSTATIAERQKRLKSQQIWDWNAD